MKKKRLTKKQKAEHLEVENNFKQSLYFYYASCEAMHISNDDFAKNIIEAVSMTTNTIVELAHNQY